ncbi:hypothetical protein BH23ACT10_BH23ACT10_28800 [soil metagenome]
MIDVTADVWVEARGVPDALRRTLDDATGFADVIDLLRGARRIVASGNGAAYYVALAMDLAAQETAGAPEVKAVPAGMLSSGRFVWRDGDVLLSVSSSGQQRDIIEALEQGAPPHYATVTSAPTAPIGAGATACAVVHVERQRVDTHTQAYAGNVAVVLALLAEIAGDDQLARDVDAAANACSRALDAAGRWVGELDPGWIPSAVVSFGTGTGWAGALEAALLLKEISGIPAEGLESREGATSGMFALAAQHGVLSLPTVDDRHAHEVEQICAGTGARVLRAPGGDLLEARLAPITTFPAALALSITLGQRRGLNVDEPSWTQAYRATARAPLGRGSS